MNTLLAKLLCSDYRASRVSFREQSAHFTSVIVPEPKDSAGKVDEAPAYAPIDAAAGARGLTLPPPFLLFLDLLAAEVLDRDLVELDALDVLGDLLVDFLGGGVVLERELAHA